MKKKLIVAITLILLLAISLTMFVGCDEIFKKNEERDGKQIVASVTYDGQTENIYKYELVSQFNSSAYAYVQYYGWTYQQAANSILQSLAQQKLLAMYARKKVATLMGFETMPEDLTSLLTISELNRAIDNTNESMLSALKSSVESSVNEDRYNSGSTDTVKKDETTDTEVTDPVFVRFETNGAGTIECQRIQKSTKAKKPANPTKEGYTFYGWYQSADFPEADPDATDEENADKGEFDFDTTVNNSITLYAKWVEYRTPRNEMPKVEEEDDYDPEIDDDSIAELDKFYTAAYKATIYDKLVEEDFVKNIYVPSGKTLEATLKTYIDNSYAEIEKNVKNNIYKSTFKECYDYYFANQVDSLLITKMRRLIGKTVTVEDSEVEDEFKRVLELNQQTFTGVNGDTRYSSALTSSLNKTYYHTSTDSSYGFVINILLRLSDSSLNKLKDMYNANPSNLEAIKIMRNRLLSEMTVKVSNPVYDSTAIVEDKDGNEIELRDPMTDPKNPYNNVPAANKVMDTSKQKEGGNNYNELLTFTYNEEAGVFEIVYGATEHPAMPYLLNDEVPAFDKDGKVGVIHQIYNSFEQVKAYVNSGKLTREQGVYWLREVATKWLYLVGDDTGAVTDSSNNNGLGYLITPEGQTSSYLADFTSYARALIAKGTGSYYAGDSTITADHFKGAAVDGTLAGDGVTYVAADSFIGTGTTDLTNAYAGIFVLLNSYTVWDTQTYPELASADGALSINHIMTYAKDTDDIKTIGQSIYDSLLSAKQTLAYNLDVNTMALENMEKGIVYYEKAYQSLWK